MSRGGSQGVPQSRAAEGKALGAAIRNTASYSTSWTSIDRERMVQLPASLGQPASPGSAGDPIDTGRQDGCRLSLQS